MSAARSAERPRSGRRARRVGAPRLDLRQAIPALAYVVVGLALACAMAWPLYETVRLPLVAGFAAVVGIGTALAGQRFRLPLWQRIGLVAILYLLGVVPLAIPAALSSPLAILRGLVDGLTGVVLGWKQLLTLDLPVGQYQAVLVPAYALFVVGAAVAATLAISPGRRAPVAVPVVLTMVVFGIAFGRTDPGEPFVAGAVRIDSPREVLLGLLAVAASLAWLGLRARLRRRAALAEARGSVRTSRLPGASAGAAVRRRVLASAIVVVALVVGLTAGPALAGTTPRETLRTSTEPLLVVQQQPTPLGRYRASFEKGSFDRPLFTVEKSGSAVDRLTIATLDAWDGEHFLVSDDERFARLPGGTPAAGASRVRVTIGEGYSGIWLPLPAGVRTAPEFGGGRAAALADAFFLDKATGSGIDIAQDGESRSGAATRGVRSGDSYTVMGTGTPQVPLGAPGGGSLLDLPEHPQLAAWIKAQKQPKTADGFAELISRLRERGYLSHSLAEDEAASDWIAALRATSSYPFEPSFAGHSTARTEALFRQLLEQQNRVGDGASNTLLVAGVGDDEQFAAAAALLARAYGYESRVVVGVRLGSGSTGGIPDCSRECTGANLAAWVEVRSPGSPAWTLFDVEPQFTTPPSLISLQHQLPKNPTVPERPQAEAVQPPAAQHDDQDASRSEAVEQPAWVTVLLRVLAIAGLVAGTLLLLVLPVLAVLIAKRVRRRGRRGQPVPEVAVVAAWEELMDARTDGGASIPRGTRREVAAEVGSPVLAELAALVDSAVFAEHPPTREAAERAWQLVDTERARLRSERGPVPSLLAAVNPASFLRSLGRPRLPGLSDLLQGARPGRADS